MAAWSQTVLDRRGLLPGLEFVTEQDVPLVTEPAAARPSRSPLAGATGGSRRAAAEGDVLCTSAHVGML